MAYDPGDTVELVFDVAGADESTTAVLTLELPDGTTTEPTPAGPAEGRFTATYVPAQPGRYGVRWVSTAPGQATSDVFDVRPVQPQYLISLADAKNHLRITTTRHDEKLRGHIETATAAIEEYLHEAIVRRTVTQKIRVDQRALQLVLDHYPVVSITSATVEGTAADVSGWDVDDVGILTLPAAVSGTVVVTYIAGRSVIPPEVLHAAKLVVEQLYSPQRSPAAGPPSAPGGEDELEPDAYGVVMTAQVRELLGVTGPLVG